MNFQCKPLFQLQKTGFVLVWKAGVSLTKYMSLKCHELGWQRYKDLVLLIINTFTRCSSIFTFCQMVQLSYVSFIYISLIITL